LLSSYCGSLERSFYLDIYKLKKIYFFIFERKTFCLFIKINKKIYYDKAKIGCLGLYLDTILVVNPDSEMTIIKAALMSEAVLTAAEQTDS